MTHKLYKTKEEIENWLNKYEVKNYELIEDNQYGYIVDVNEGVDLYGKNLDYIPIKFNKINGNFNCANNNINNLEFFPEEIKGDFHIYHNELTSLNYFPKIIDGEINCGNNKLINLKGCIKKVNQSFYCYNNQLESLEGCPEEINGIFNFSMNKIKTLNFFPNKVHSKCYLLDNAYLGELQYIENFEELKNVHNSIILNKKLEKEITVDNNKNNVKIKV